MQAYAIADNRRVVTLPDGTAWFPNKSGHRAHPQYVTADPAQIADRLRAAGVEVTQTVYGGMSRRHRVNPALGFLECRLPAAPGAEYASFARLLLPHNGRRSIQLAPGALRIACENQFCERSILMPHCGREAHEFVNDPAPIMLRALAQYEKTARLVEGLRGRGRDNGAAAMFLLELTTAHKRIGKSVRREWREYDAQDGGSYWTLLQALTGARMIGAQRLAERLLADHYPAMLAGEAVSILN